MMRLMSNSRRKEYGARNSVCMRPVVMQISFMATEVTGVAPSPNVTITGWREYMKATLFG
jgi:hypothetical protein